MTALAWITLIFGFSCFLSFGYGVRFYFSKPEGKTLPMYLITEVGITIALLHVGLLAWYGVWHQQLDPWMLAGTLALFGLSLAMFWWSLHTVREHRLSFAYTKDVPQLLIAGGPYRFIRHPFYTAYILGFFAAPLALAGWWLLPTSFFMFCLYWQAAVLEEDKFAKSELAEQYDAYKRRTGRFLPRLFPASKHPGAQ